MHNRTYYNCKNVNFVSFQRHRRTPNLWNHLLPTVLAIALSIESSASGQCFGGVETYEKTAGTTVVCTAGDGCNSRGLLTQPDTSVTRDCIAICKQSSACNVFTVGKMNRGTDEQRTDEQTDGQMGRQKDGVVNRWTDEGCGGKTN
jgi:hypothetical protein